MGHARIVCALGVMFAAVTGFGCGGGQVVNQALTPEGTAQLRVVQASSQYPAVIVSVDGAVLTSSLAYQAQSNYSPVQSGARHVILAPISGTKAPAVDATITLSPDTNSTLVANGFGFATGYAMLLDDTTPASDSGVKLRILNLSSMEVDAYVVPEGTAPNGKPALSALCTYPACTSEQQKYLPLSPGTYDIDITTAGKTQVVYAKTKVTIESGQNRTLLLVPNCPVCTGPVCVCNQDVLTSMLLNDLN
jgi:Domain of unknown function (DUF4397)